MEVQMKAICEGRTTRNDVVQQNLDKYRAVFNRTNQQINVLKSVGGRSQVGIWSCVCSRIANVAFTSLGHHKVCRQRESWLRHYPCRDAHVTCCRNNPRCLALWQPVAARPVGLTRVC